MTTTTEYCPCCKKDEEFKTLNVRDMRSGGTSKEQQCTACNYVKTPVYR